MGIRDATPSAPPGVALNRVVTTRIASNAAASRLRASCVVAAASAFAFGCGGMVSADPSGEDSTSTADASTHVTRDAAGGGFSQGDGGAAGSCSVGACPAPGDVSRFVPTWRPPTGAHQGLCTPALIDEFYQDCLGTGAGPCSVFGPAGDAAHQACGRCMTSGIDDAAWGPVVASPGLVETNGAGCIALLDPSAIDCAKAVQALDECEHAACDPTCNAASGPAFDDWVQCSAAANACGCAPWLAASNCTQAIAADAGPAAACLVGQTFQDFFEITAQVFCGD
jgi:hypothetical protein